MDLPNERAARTTNAADRRRDDDDDDDDDDRKSGRAAQIMTNVRSPVSCCVS